MTRPFRRIMLACALAAWVLTACSSGSGSNLEHSFPRDQGSAPPGRGAVAADSARADSIAALLSEAQVPGLAVAYLKDCRVVRVATFGEADAETHAPVTERTAFEAASLSKPVFAYLVIRLVGEGRIDLKASIAERLAYPRIADQDTYAALTPQIVLSHRTGLPNWAGHAGDPERTDTLAFASAPGAAFGYSGEGYQLLQAYVAAVTGRSLEQLFRDHLGDAMLHSTYTSPLPSDVTPAYGHGEQGGKGGGRAMIAPETPSAAFSLRTVAGDYGRFLGRVCRGEGLSGVARAEMLAPRSSVRGDEWGADPSSLEQAKLSWALGWGVQRLDGRAVYFHWGDNGAFKAFAAFDPDRRTGLVYFANGRGGLRLIEPLAAAVVGTMQPVVTWLNE